VSFDTGIRAETDEELALTGRDVATCAQSGWMFRARFVGSESYPGGMFVAALTLCSSGPRGLFPADSRGPEVSTAAVPKSRRARTKAGHMPAATLVAMMASISRSPFTFTVSPFFRAESFAFMEPRVTCVMAFVLTS
jgi:hypothetical protein